MGATVFQPKEPAPRFLRHCRATAEERAACRSFCMDALSKGGKTGVPLLNILFPASK